MTRQENMQLWLPGKRLIMIQVEHRWRVAQYHILIKDKGIWEPHNLLGQRVHIRYQHY